MDITCTITVDTKGNRVFSRAHRRIDSTDELGNAFLLRGRIMEDCAELVKKAATAIENYEVENKPEDTNWLEKTNRDFWNCECKKDYIHHISKTDCGICGIPSTHSKHALNREIIEYFAADMPVFRAVYGAKESRIWHKHEKLKGDNNE